MKKKNLNKQQLALAIALILSAPSAFAQAKVSVFGNVNIQLENIKAEGAVNANAASPDKPERWRMSNVSSDLGVRASVDLGNGLSGVAQYVTGVQADGNGQGGNTAGIFSSAKDVFVGLKLDDVGTVKIGRLTAASRWISGTPDFSPAGAGPQDHQAAFAKTGGGTRSTPLFNDRMDNAIGFESASFAGFNARLYLSANENRSNSQLAAGPSLNDRSYSVALQYVNGPIDLRVSTETRRDKGTLNTTTANSTSDKDTRFAARYTLPTKTILAIGYGQMAFTDATITGAAKSNLKKTGWVLGAKHTIDKHAIYGGVARSGDYSCSNANGSACDSSATGMKQWVIAYNYQWNKEMLLEAFATQLSNDSRARYDFDSGGISPSTGAKPTAIGVGLRYSF